MTNITWEQISGVVWGLIGGRIGMYIMGITWDRLLSEGGHVLWLGFIAFFTGAMGALGTHLAKKYIINKKQNK